MDEHKHGGGPGAGPGGPGAPAGSKPEDHADHTAQMWEDAFWQALRELHVEAVKTKLKASWGPRIDAMAGAAVEAMKEEWEAFRQKEKADERVKKAYEGFKEKIEKTFEKGPQ